jgi:copper chaperone
MLTFSVPDMSCGGCASAITKAVQKLDPAARVTPDLGAKLVSIETVASADALVEALGKAGFPAKKQ